MSPFSKEMAATELRRSLDSKNRKTATPSAVFDPESINKSIEMISLIAKMGKQDSNEMLRDLSVKLQETYAAKKNIFENYGNVYTLDQSMHVTTQEDVTPRGDGIITGLHNATLMPEAYDD